MKFRSPLFRVRTAIFIIVPLLLLGSYAVHEVEGHSYGYTGVSKIGCGTVYNGCHGTKSANTVISISTASPEIAVGQTYIFRISVANSDASEVAAGCDISANNGAKLSLNGTKSGLYLNYGELTHTSPQVFSGDSAVWLFKYTAPTKAGMAHIYAAGNAVNGDTYADAGDHWNLDTVTFNVVAAGVTPAQNQDAAVCVFPNPSSTGRFTLSTLGLFGPSEVVATDASGRTVFHTSMQLGGEEPLDLSSLPNGTYFISIRTRDGQSLIRRVVLER